MDLRQVRPGVLCRTRGPRVSRLTRRVIAVLFLAVAPSLVNAQAVPPTGQPGASNHLDLGVGIEAGLLGFGGEVNKLLFGHLGVRADFSTVSITLNPTYKSIKYSGNIKLQGAPVIVDFYPFARGSLHLSGGVVFNQTQLSGSGSGNSFTLNGTSYTAAQVGTLGLKVKFPSAGPYLGLGFGTPARGGRVGFFTNFGAIISKPSATLTSTGGTGQPAGFQSDLQAQSASTNQDARKLPVLPVFSMGLMVRF